MEEKKKVNKRSFSRFFATQILFSYFSDTSENKDISDLKSFMEEYYISDEFSQDDSEEYKKDVNIDFLDELLNGVLNNLEKIDNILNENLTGKYTFNVIDKLIAIILRLAVYEFNWTNTDKKIIINEYVDIASEFFDPKATSFVNAILDKLLKINSNI